MDCLMREGELCTVTESNCAEVKPEICKLIWKAVKVAIVAGNYGYNPKEEFENGEDYE